MIKLSKAIIKEVFARNERWISDDNIEIPECYTKIDEYTLRWLSATKININEVTTIGKHACVGCYNLKEIYLPKAEEIESGFCYSCPNLEK